MSQAGERDISRGVLHEREAHNEGNIASEISRSPRLAHKAPVMQARQTPFNVRGLS